MSKRNRNELPTFTSRPRLPEEAREKIRSGGAHRNKKAHNRASEKRELQRQIAN